MVHFVDLHRTVRAILLADAYLGFECHRRGDVDAIHLDSRRRRVFHCLLVRVAHDGLVVAWTTLPDLQGSATQFCGGCVVLGVPGSLALGCVSSNAASASRLADMAEADGGSRRDDRPMHGNLRRLRSLHSLRLDAARKTQFSVVPLVPFSTRS